VSTFSVEVGAHSIGVSLAKTSPVWLLLLLLLLLLPSTAGARLRNLARKDPAGASSISASSKGRMRTENSAVSAAQEAAPLPLPLPLPLLLLLPPKTRSPATLSQCTSRLDRKSGVGRRLARHRRTVTSSPRTQLLREKVTLAARKEKEEGAAARMACEKSAGEKGKGEARGSSVGDCGS
jgi:hypothetical protein